MRKEDLEKEYNYLKLCYSAHLNQNEKLLKSLVYLEWKMDYRIKSMEENIIKFPKQKEILKQKILIMEQIKNEIHSEINKSLKDCIAEDFEYPGVDKLTNGFFGM